MAEMLEKNKAFLLSEDCNPKTPLARAFAGNMRLFMAEQGDFTEEDRKKYHKKLTADIKAAKK